MASPRAVLLLLVATSVGAVPPAEQAWLDFKNAFGKEYANGDDEQSHYDAFKSNLDVIEELRKGDDSAAYSHLTPFADVAPEEFKRTHCGFRPAGASLDALGEEATPNSSVPDAFDWRSKGAVNPVKNQASCGSCWAFATVANVEGVNFVANKQLVSLSEQELVDCVKEDEGCGGGLPSDAYQDMVKSHRGFELETVYPYEAKNGQCRAQASQEKVFITGFKKISTDEGEIAAALVQYGPLAIGINAGPMQLYFGGVANPWSILCNPKQLDHGVAIVGFGVDGSKKYWAIRNSWGASWGEKGYYRIIRGVGKCGLNTMVTTATMGSEARAVIV